jgi:Fic family protein
MKQLIDNINNALLNNINNFIPDAPINNNTLNENKEVNINIKLNNININSNILINIFKFHAEFLRIRPFLDGNGRVARLLTNLLLQKAGYVPIYINIDDKNKYYTLLELANNGEIDDFIIFMLETTKNIYENCLKIK